MTTTRFAPSPTGHIHVGNLRTALMNFLVARKGNGKFILRIDDTDPERSRNEFADAIKEDLEWLGLHWDREERQSRRLDRYSEAAARLRDAGRLYEAFETPVELDLKRKKQRNIGRPPVYDRAALAVSASERERLRSERGNGVWRFKLDHERIEWVDGILGGTSIDASSVSDPVLIRRDGQVLYTLASVADDIDMHVTHVVRGSDHVTNTATQIQIARALGGKVPEFAHHSLLVGPDGGNLSKRLGALSIRKLREQGVEPMALLSLMARLGSSDGIELFGNMEDMIKAFDISRFGVSATRFASRDLLPLTARHLQKLDYAAVKDRVARAGVPNELGERFWMVSRDNITTMDDIGMWWGLCSEGAEPVIDDEDREFVAEALKLLPDGPYDSATWANWTKEVKRATGRKGRGLFMPLRKALTGMSQGPEMSDLMPLLQVIRAKS
ncbi:MAG: glutamate--tRNA ligase [Roseovarius sp.]|nr:glutamate--tRNA ligase [Roseovarius sp.]MCY4207052.1 glutamate--tRNA ligase [Roseovarius sp.]MCY4291339.1 glutamate--tRNA ligase [Roseovarius sp.]MCY4315477.1 glutamate--tRNA ligase [Roseovarius sp.]